MFRRYAPHPADTLHTSIAAHLVRPALGSFRHDKTSAVKLVKRGEFPRTSWIGSKRVVGRRAFEAWLAERIGSPPAA